jgi:3-oxoacyl-[acyl-carrier protein] reductase
MAFESLAGRVVIVTGAGRGFGRLMSLGLVEAGARVVGTAARNAEELEECAAACNRLAAGTFHPVMADVSKLEDCESTVAAALERFGRVDALVNNAARGPIEACANFYEQKLPFWEVDAAAWKRMIDTNLTGQYFMSRAAAPHMVEQGFGRIINISTSRVTMVRQGLAAYGAAKAGLEASSILWSRDLAGTGVTVNVLLPGGAADTALLPGGGVGALADPTFRQGKGPTDNEGRPGGVLPAEIMVEPTLWLCADESSAFTGRRLIAKDWDPDLPPADAAERAMQAMREVPEII